MRQFVLGIDTSCYTSSVAVASARGIDGEARIPLIVKPGEKGLRQSEALFQHVRNLPVILRRVLSHGDWQPVAVAASKTPRPVEGSYMPVFLAGTSFGEALAAAWDVPFFGTTHQEGHLEAGYHSAGIVAAQELLAVHLSGGTSELLKASRRPGHWDVSLLGGSTDLSAGQFVDRVGQALHLPFPSGPHLEELARNGVSGRLTIPSPVNDYQISFSGPATAALRAIRSGIEPADVALAVLCCVAESVRKWLTLAIQAEKIRDVLIVGGVAANRLIREILTGSIGHHSVGGRLHFADPALSGDNAAGVALLGWQLFSGAAPSTGPVDGKCD